VGRALTVHGGIGQLHPDTQAASIEPAVSAAARPLRLQFHEQPPDGVLAEAARVLALHPDVELRAYDRTVDPSLAWLSGFERVRHLQLDLWHATSFDVLARFVDLRTLSLGQTASKRPSLAFVRELAHLEVLSVEAHDKDFDAVADVASLRRLHLHRSRARSLEALRGHPAIEVFAMHFGAIRDLGPLADVPRLRGVELYQVRKLDTDDLDALGACHALEALSLGALRNVTGLGVLGGHPRTTLRYLTLEHLTGLATLADVARCEALEQLGLYESRPADKQLDVLLRAPNLRHLVVGDVYPRDQVEAMKAQFDGETFRYRADYLRGNGAGVEVAWRRPVHEYLGGADG